MGAGGTPDGDRHWSSSSGQPAQALYSRACCSEDAFGTSSAVRRPGQNFKALFADETYLASFKTTAVFSLLGGAPSGLSVSLLLAVMADRVVKGSAAVQNSLLIWPYAVAPVVAGVLWLFMFAPSIGVVSYGAAREWASTGTTCSTARTR